MRTGDCIIGRRVNVRESGSRKLAHFVTEIFAVFVCVCVKGSTQGSSQGARCCRKGSKQEDVNSKANSVRDTRTVDPGRLLNDIDCVENVGGVEKREANEVRKTLVGEDSGSN